MSSTNPLAGADWDGSASAYDAFEKRWGYYADVGEKLVDGLGIKADSKVLELAGGSGACTLVLSRLCPSGRVVSVERSAAMVALARQNAKAAGARNITLVEGDASDLAELVAGEERFDFAVCSGAFWQFREAEKVAEAIHGLLVPGGPFAFNLPPLSRFTTDRRTFRKAVDGILRAHGVDPPTFWRVAKRRDFRGVLKRAGFASVKETKYDVATSPQLQMEWRTIPVFARRWGNFGALAPEISREILEAVGRVPLGHHERRSRWKRFVGRKPNSTGPPSVK